LPFVALGLLALAHLFDYSTFLVMTNRHGLAAELNPVVIFVATDFGLAGVTIAKIASVAFLAVMIITLARLNRGRVAGVLLAIGIVAGVIGGLSNIAST
jgi:hypothetical protein